ncbi:PorP/SprF family type IX secretion system membrane protein [Mariniflexile jejuense]|uniref:PorP/SprF family type IX secretion system membrane protein n=1 Tax=Mariniflexile jejuense TaxID=1173582 RepID=A0ABW3JEC4_9FLAO
MIKQLLYVVICFCFAQMLYSQEDGVVAFSLPVCNSFKFNKYAINPTFSFVREQNKYISFTNKRQWVQFDNAPQTYLFSYSGRFGENTGAGIGLFQQNYGVLTTFGGVLNYAQNVVLDRDSNLTFGLNLGVYKSGINEGNVITNFPDSSLENIPSNMLFTIAPGINYGTTFFDFGVSLNNIVSYNLKTSKIIEDNPEQSIQAHVLYTGYVESRGFFDRSKFSGLVRSEFKKEQTVISGIMMLNIPKGLWAQAGYNTLYGLSAGIGLNITNQIAIEYNFEKEMGDMVSFGNSHEITLAYKFRKNQRYNYNDDDDEEALFSSSGGSKKVLAKTGSTSTKVDRAAIAEAKAQAKADALAKLEAKKQERLKSLGASKANQVIENQSKEAEEIVKAKLEQEAKAKAESEEVAKAKAEAARIQLAAETKAKAEAEEVAKAKLEQDAKAKTEEAARVKLEQEEKIKQEELDAALILKPTNPTEIAINNLTKLATDSKLEQDALLLKLNETVSNREKDLKDLKQENDLSEQGIFTEPKPFKSVSAENAELESLKVQIDDVIKSQDAQIINLENLYKERLKAVPNAQDSINTIYLNEILILKEAQAKAKRSKESLVSELETIKIATEIERKRRIKRAEYDNEQDRYNKDRAVLNSIKQFTEESTVPLKKEDFDFGEEQTENIQIIKDVSNVESGYYLVIAVHSDTAKRDEFLRKSVAAGQKNIDFFFDVATNKYYIYYEKFEDINGATNAIQAKGSTPYNGKMSLIKIEN